MKPAFLEDIDKLPSKDMRQIMEKVKMLMQDPLPDGDLKKHLTHCTGKPYRIRSGDYRIFYTFNQDYVNIYKIDRRRESTYKDCPEAEYGLEGISSLAELEISDKQKQHANYPDWGKPVEDKRPFPEPLTVELLNMLHVPVK